MSSIKRGRLFATFHWNDMYAPDVATNDVLHSAADPISKEPDLKHCAVRVEKRALRRGSGARYFVTLGKLSSKLRGWTIATKRLVQTVS